MPALIRVIGSTTTLFSQHSAKHTLVFCGKVGCAPKYIFQEVVDYPHWQTHPLILAEKFSAPDFITSARALHSFVHSSWCPATASINRRRDHKFMAINQLGRGSAGEALPTDTCLPHHRLVFLQKLFRLAAADSERRSPHETAVGLWKTERQLGQIGGGGFDRRGMTPRLI